MRKYVAAFFILWLSNSALCFQLPTIGQLSWALGAQDKIPTEFIPIDNSTTFPLKSPYWIKVQLESPKQGSYILQVGSSYMRAIQGYNENEQLIFQGCDLLIDLNQGANTIYLHYPFQDINVANPVDFKLFNPVDYYMNQQRVNTLGAVFISIVLFLFLLSASFYIVSRWSDIIYLHYAWYLLSVFVFFSYQYGYLGQWWPIFNKIPPTYLWISSASITVSYLFFAQSFLNLDKTDRKVYMMLNFGKYFVLSVVLVETITYFFGYDIQHSVIYKGIVLLVQVTLMPYILYRCYLQKTTLSWIFVCGAFILVITTLAGQAVSTFKFVANTNLYIQAGLIIEIFIFSIGIGIRMVLINKEKRVAQFKLIDQLKLNEEIQQNFIQDLEYKVAERTKSLALRNEEYQILLREIHHRVKNNLQTISSLLNIQQRRLKDPAAISAIEDSKSRVQVMGLLHKFLYQRDNFEEIALRPYLKQLVLMLCESHKTQHEVTTVVKVDDISCGVDMSINIGLIVNELVMNILKHSSPGRGALNISLTLTSQDHTLNLSVSDNGNSPPDTLPHNNPGFGWRLIQSLIDKIDGDITSEFSNGMEIEAVIPRPHNTKVYATVP